MMDECPVWNETVRDALEKGKYYELLMGKGEHWIELEKYCERGGRLWHNRSLVVQEILEWSIWKDDVKGVMAKFSDALEHIAEDDPLVVLDTLHAYVGRTVKAKFTYFPQEEEMDIDFGLDCWRFYDLARSKESNLEQYHYNEDELRVYHRLLEVLSQYFPTRN